MKKDWKLKRKLTLYPTQYYIDYPLPLEDNIDQILRNAKKHFEYYCSSGFQFRLPFSFDDMTYNGWIY